MTLADEYRDALRDENIARLRRILALRAMVATGMSQREIALALGVSQPAVSQQLKAAPDMADVHPETLIEAAGPILRGVALDRGFTNVAIFGSVAGHRARHDSDIDLLIEPPPDTTISGLLSIRTVFERILGHSVDLITYGGLKPDIDDDIRREAVLL